MRKLRWAIAAIAVLGLIALPKSYADMTVKDGAGATQTMFDFTCFTTKHCTTSVLTKSDGTEIATSTNPVRVDPTGTTTQPVSASTLPLPTGAATSANQTSELTKLDTLITNSSAGLNASANDIGGVYNAGRKYETVAASQTGQTMGPAGATGDYLSHCVVYPQTTSPGVVTVFDNTSSATNDAIAFLGGTTSVSNLVPFAIPVGAISLNGAWKVTTGANVKVTCFGKFT